MTTTPAPTRREQILLTAADLFARRGFHGVSVAELGSACGISGPALYKHFASKDAMLSEMLVGISETLLAGGRERVAEATSPDSAVRALVDWHVDFAVTRRSLIVLQDRDWEALSAEARDRVRTLQRAYVDLWAEQLTARDPGLGLQTARAKTRAVFGLINSTPRNRVLSDEETRELLTSMSLAALG